MKAIPVRHIKPAEQSALGRFSIRKIEHVLDGSDLQHDLHRHNFFFMLLVQSGEGVHEIDFVPHAVTDGSVFLLRPGQVHQLCLKTGATGYLMEFDTEFYRPTDKSSAHRFRRAAGKNRCHPETATFERLNALLSDVFEEYTNKDDGYADAIKATLEIFFINYIRQSKSPDSINPATNAYIQERFEEFTELVERNFKTHKQVSHYADLMNLSSYQLNEITKTTIGKTASLMIDEYIILEAKRYLLATASQIKEIADHLGYEDPSYFIRFFRKHTGLSPDAFRKNFK
jgi:AraC-like DNA-binding protein